jgi:cytosine deaminase
MMTPDLIIKNATLPDGRTGIDIACAGGRIVALEPNITGEAARVIEASGRLVSPPFVDCHFHMDATLSLGTPRLNWSGTLLWSAASRISSAPWPTVPQASQRFARLPRS